MNVDAFCESILCFGFSELLLYCGSKCNFFLAVVLSGITSSNLNATSFRRDADSRSFLFNNTASSPSLPCVGVSFENVFVARILERPKTKNVQHTNNSSYCDPIIVICNSKMVCYILPSRVDSVFGSST